MRELFSFFVLTIAVDELEKQEAELERRIIEETRKRKEGGPAPSPEPQRQQQPPLLAIEFNVDKEEKK